MPQITISSGLYVQLPNYDKMDREFIIFIDNVFNGVGCILKIVKEISDDEVLHYLGRAVDVEIPSDGRLVFDLFDSIMLYKGNRPIELVLHSKEILHIGLFPNSSNKRSTLELI